MIIGNAANFVYVNGANFPYDIQDVPDNFDYMEEGQHYIVNDVIYRYDGEVNSPNDIEVGSIGKYLHNYYINIITEFQEEYKDRSMDYIRFKDEYEKETTDAEAIVRRYIQGYIKGNNNAIGLDTKIRNTGDVYMPVIKDTDDILTRLMKLMILDKKIILANYKDKTPKDYNIDNLRSALNGTTANMTISKFLSWCDILGLQWKFELFDDNTVDPHPYPLGEKVVISWDKDLVADFGPSESGIFKVDINKNDDPLKKLIKYAVWKKRMVLADYRDKGATPHQINNMRSALKRKSKMMIGYFYNWCDLLGVTYNITLHDPETGITHYGNKFYRSNDYQNDNVLVED